MSTAGDNDAYAALIDEVTARVNENLRSIEQVPAPIPVYDSLHEAASVLAWFIPEELHTADHAKIETGAIEVLLADSRPTVDAGGIRRWTLIPEVRVTCLRQLRVGERVAETVAANSERSSDPIQVALDRYLGGTAPAIAAQSRVEVSASSQVCDWLRAAGFGRLPRSSDVDARIGWFKFLQPFEYLTGEFFSGRTAELAQLRAFADVVAPGSIGEAARRIPWRILSGRKRPFLIYGPGGVGKSALLARFILEHAHAHERDRFPFVYLDFDRLDVDAAEPLTLLIEAVRQLAIEYPGASEGCERIREFWIDQLAMESVRGDRRGSVYLAERFRGSPVEDFKALIESLGAEDRPVLFVLDTFEEVQWRSNEYVKAICQLLDDLQRAISRLRVCIVGRGQLSEYTSNELELSGLDEEAATGYLRARDVAPAAAKRLARQLGGSPLTLKLAAELVKIEGLQDGRLDIGAGRFFAIRLTEERIQAELYGRILGHIHDKNVRKVAHPGLVLRRITADLILNVLSGPCELRIETITEARELFEGLAREVSLVSPVSGNILEHRHDLRRAMLGLLEADEPAKVADIHWLAIRWYEHYGTSSADRAEEIYHRIASGQDLSLIDARWIPEVGSHLESAYPEFRGARRAYLAYRLGFEVDSETRQLADLEDWEGIVGRQASKLAAVSEFDDALRLIRTRSGRTDCSPLFGIEASLLASIGHWREALEVLDRGLSRASAAGAYRQALDLALGACELVLNQPAGVMPPGPQVHRLRDLYGSSLPPGLRLTVLAHIIALSRREPSLVNPGIPADALNRLRPVLDGLDDDVLAEDLLSAHWAASVLKDAQDAVRIARVMIVCGLPVVDESRLRELAAAIALSDPGFLAATLGVERQDSLISAWADYLLAVGEPGRQLGGALRTIAGLLPIALVEAFADVMRPALRYQDQRPDEVVVQPSKRRTGRPGALLAEISDALLSVLTSPSLLRQFQEQGLGRSLESYDPYHSLGTREIVRRLVAEADADGSLEQLLATALKSYPTNAQLSRVATELGITTFLSGAPDLSNNLRRDPVSLSLLGSRADQVSSQICRVESDGRVLGTGVLVGSDLVLTASHLIGQLKVPTSSGLRTRFGLTTGMNERVISAGKAFKVDRVLAINPELDFALLRVQGSPGVQPVNEEWRGPGGELRRWIDMAHPPDIGVGSGLAMVSYARQGGVELALDERAVTGFSTDGTRLTYQLPSRVGSSGSPCFDLAFELVAMHLAGQSGARSRPVEGSGVLVSVILHELDHLGLRHLIERKYI